MHHKLGSTAASLATGNAVSTLTAEEGASSASTEEREAAKLSLASAMAENAPGVSQHLMPRLGSMLDLEEHNSLSPTQIKIYKTPPGAPLPYVLGLQVHQLISILSAIALPAACNRSASICPMYRR